MEKFPIYSKALDAVLAELGPTLIDQATFLNEFPEPYQDANSSIAGMSKAEVRKFTKDFENINRTVSKLKMLVEKTGATFPSRELLRLNTVSIQGVLVDLSSAARLAKQTLRVRITRQRQQLSVAGEDGLLLALSIAKSDQVLQDRFFIWLEAFSGGSSGPIKIKLPKIRSASNRGAVLRLEILKKKFKRYLVGHLQGLDVSVGAPRKAKLESLLWEKLGKKFDRYCIAKALNHYHSKYPNSIQDLDRLLLEPIAGFRFSLIVPKLSTDSKPSIKERNRKESRSIREVNLFEDLNVVMRSEILRSTKHKHFPTKH